MREPNVRDIYHSRSKDLRTRVPIVPLAIALAALLLLAYLFH